VDPQPLRRLSCGSAAPQGSWREAWWFPQRVDQVLDLLPSRGDHTDVAATSGIERVSGSDGRRPVIAVTDEGLDTRRSVAMLPPSDLTTRPDATREPSCPEAEAAAEILVGSTPAVSRPVKSVKVGVRVGLTQNMVMVLSW
jgi:hypothetical protein